MALGIEGTSPTPLEVLKITGHDEEVGGILKVRVSRAYPMSIVEAAVDGGAFEQKAMLPMSEITIQVPDSVQLRARGAERDGTPSGDYTEIRSVTSRA